MTTKQQQRITRAAKRRGWTVTTERDECRQPTRVVIRWTVDR